MIVEIGKEEVIVGKLEFLKEHQIETEPIFLKEIYSHQNEGYTVVAVSRAKEIIGFIALSDEVRADAKLTIDNFRLVGVDRIIMLTGDNARVAAKVSKDLGITEYHANLLPEDKLKFVKGELGKKGKLAMVGDGVNDAASLALADVGIAMGAIGSDAAIEAADIALMQDDLSKVVEAVNLGRYTVKISKEDFLLWGVINMVGLALVFTGVIGPQGAALFNFITDFFPITNSLRTLHYK